MNQVKKLQNKVNLLYNLLGQETQAFSFSQILLPHNIPIMLIF